MPLPVRRIAVFIASACLAVALSACASDPGARAVRAVETATPRAAGPASNDRVREAVLPSTALRADWTYRVFVPAAYEDEPNRRFPVVYWLHGSMGSPQAASGPVASMFDAAIESGRIPPLLVVFPDGLGQSMWVDSKDGRVPMETMLVRELVPHVDAHYRTIPSPRGRIVEGASMGGYGAARLGLRHPGVFGAASMLSAGPMQEILDPRDAPIVGAAAAQATIDRVYGGDSAYFQAQSPWSLAERTSSATREHLVLRQFVGGDDGVLEQNLRFSAHLDALGIPHALIVLPGVDHSPPALFGALADDERYWSFFADFLAPEATESP